MLDWPAAALSAPPALGMLLFGLKYFRVAAAVPEQ